MSVLEVLCEGLGDLVVDFCGVLECVVGEGLVAVDLGCAVGEVFGGGVFGVVGAFEGVAAEEGAWWGGGGCGADVVVAHGFYSVVGFGGVVVLLWWCISGFWCLAGGVVCRCRILRWVLHGFFFVWYDMGVRRFVYY